MGSIPVGGAIFFGKVVGWTMKFYDNAASTPLEFHKAFYKVLSPIFIAVQALILLATIGYLRDYSSGTLILNLLLSCGGIAALGYITYGFSKQRPYAYHTVFIYLGISVLSSIISAVGSTDLAAAVGRVIGGSIIPVLIGIYYYKRKFVFLSDESDKSDKSDASETSDVSDRTEIRGANPAAANPAVICYCRKCGNRVPEGSAFCNKCGAKIDWN